jgi:SAM-dependent methyltransferase
MSLATLVRRYTPPFAKRFVRDRILDVGAYARPSIFRNRGHCPCCDSDTWFIADSAWFRDSYRCARCESIPRERALMWVIEHFRPDWRSLIVHESSPVRRGATVRLSRECPQYIGSQFLPNVQSGETVGGVRCEDLEALSFPDASVDLHVTQDVLEHVFDPDAAFLEIARTLKPGGMHIFTTPLERGSEPTERRASLVNGRVVHHYAPEYHGNPVSPDGALVTMHWGYDITDHIARASGLFTEIVYLDALEFGIRADYIEVMVTRKPVGPQQPDDFTAMIAENEAPRVGLEPTTTRLTVERSTN